MDDASIESVTRTLLTRALDAAVLRQQVFAANLANSHLPGSRPGTVSFEASLSRATDEWQSTGRVGAASLADAAAAVEDLVDVDGTPRSLQPDEQVSQMAVNAVHHQVLLQGLSRHLAILALAASEGRR